MTLYRTVWGDTIPSRDNLNDGCELEYPNVPKLHNSNMASSLTQQRSSSMNVLSTIKAFFTIATAARLANRRSPSNLARPLTQHSVGPLHHARYEGEDHKAYKLRRMEEARTVRAHLLGIRLTKMWSGRAKLGKAATRALKREHVKQLKLQGRFQPSRSIQHA